MVIVKHRTKCCVLIFFVWLVCITEILCKSIRMCNLLVHLHIGRPRHTVLLIGFPVIRKAVADIHQRKEVVLTQGLWGHSCFCVVFRGWAAGVTEIHSAFFFSLSTALFGLYRAITARANLSLQCTQPSSRINILFSNHNMYCLVLFILNWDHFQISHHLTFQSVIKSSAIISFYFSFFLLLSFKMFSFNFEPSRLRKSNLSKPFR